jgi:dethiobiotin synthetase
MTRGLFVTGTDTGVGKTAVSAMLLRALATAGHRAAGMKPVATGLAASRFARALVRRPATAREPVRVRGVCAELAARAAAGHRRANDVIAAAYGAFRAGRQSSSKGASGALVPLTRCRYARYPADPRLPVLLVVGIRLGCLNHALMSALAINARGLARSLAGSPTGSIRRCAKATRMSRR